MTRSKATRPHLSAPLPGERFQDQVGINIGWPKADGLTEGPDGFSASSHASIGNAEIMVDLRQIRLIVEGFSKVFCCLG